MRKIFALLLALALALTLVSCGDKNDAMGGGTTEPTNSTTETINDPTDGTQGTTESTTETTLPATAPSATEPPVTNPSATTPPATTPPTTEPVHAHSYSSQVTAPTCTTQGYTTYTCSCGDSYVSDMKPNNDHDFGEWQTIQEPLTDATGVAERTCTDCGTKETKTLGKLVTNHTHSYTSTIVRTATCAKEGKKRFTCSCGESYTETIAKTSHNYTANIVEPTCTTDGYIKYICSCGDRYTVTTAAKDHSYRKVVTEPACAAVGYTTYICDCGYSYRADYTNAKGHSWGGWVTEAEADVGKAGLEKRTCSICQASQTQSIPALQEDLIKKWFLTQYDIAKQQYINGLNNSIGAKQSQIDDLTEDASTLYVSYMKEIQKINERYANAAGTKEAALRDAQLAYTRSAKIYTDQITALENEIAEIEEEVDNPNVDNILAIVTKNCNITSRETYEYYYKYSDSIS